VGQSTRCAPDFRYVHRADAKPTSHQATSPLRRLPARSRGRIFAGEITPRPPFRIEKGGSDGWLLGYDEKVATGGERTLLGGLKSKTVDIVIVKNGLGPTMAVSCKGAIGAFRNLTN
jgi:hypothetical protein